MDFAQNIREDFLRDFLDFRLNIGPEADNKWILQFSILAGILQLGLPSGKLLRGRVPLLDGGGFGGKILRPADFSQPKGGITCFLLRALR